MTLTTTNTCESVDPINFFPRSALPLSFIPRTYLEGSSPSGAAERTIEAIYERLVGTGFYLAEEKRWDFDAVRAQMDGGSSLSQEKVTAELFNEVVSGAIALCKQTRSPYIWRSHESQLAESLRKPDIVLVPVSLKLLPTVNLAHIQTYCEIKQNGLSQRVEVAKSQVTELANMVGSIQFNCRFFVGSYLCGNLFYTSLHARGCTLFSGAINISERPHDFISIILHLSAASTNPVWNGFDSAIHDSGETFLTLEWGQRETIRLIHPLFTSPSIRGSSSRVWECQVRINGKGWTTCILKDCWMDEGFPSDIEIHEFLTTREPKAFPNAANTSLPTDEDVFGPADVFNVFRDCVQVEGHWDDNLHLRGIPLVRVCEAPRCEVPTLNSEGAVVMSEPAPDTTANILKRFVKGSADLNEDSPGTFELSYEPRRHIRLIYDTIGTSLIWFSSQREFFNAVMCVVIAHYNGVRMDLLHCDSSDTNVWFKVLSLAPNHVIPDFPKKGYTKRAGVLGDWGLAEDQQALKDCVAPGHITGTFPFTASELLSPKGLRGEVRHTAHHDLESLFWLVWITSINLDGPFNKQRNWSKPVFGSTPADTPTPSSTPADISCAATPTAPVGATTTEPTQSTQDSNVRFPADPPSNFCGVPIWATPGLHTLSESDVFGWKQSIPKSQFLPSVSPYWTTGEAGRQFQLAMKQLRKHFKWSSGNDSTGRPVSNPPKAITHREFLDILKVMRDAWGDDDDTPTTQDIERGRAEYRKVVEDGSFECGIMQSFGPRACIPQATTNKRPSSKRRKEGNSATPAGSKRRKRSHR